MVRIIYHHVHKHTSQKPTAPQWRHKGNVKFLLPVFTRTGNVPLACDELSSSEHSWTTCFQVIYTPSRHV